MQRSAGRLLLIILALVSVVAAVAFKVLQYESDGPLTDMIPGGELRDGPLVNEANVDWTTVLGGAGNCRDGACAPMAPVELALLEPGTSRWVGIMVHDGTLYAPCDLGFMWGRFEGAQRWVLNLIYIFKHWHEDALADGRAMVRINGTRYARHAVREEDPDLIEALKAQLEDMARSWVAPAELAPPPHEGPRDIWFFRLDAPR